MPVHSLSLREARRIALCSQGLAKGLASGKPDIRHLRRAIHRLGLLQLDFVNVLIPAHFLVLYSRLGHYDRAALARLVFERREFVEHWAHEACIVPMADWPLLEYRRRSHKPWTRGPLQALRRRSNYLEEVIEIIDKKGASTAHDMPQIAAAPRRAGDWHRSVARAALEYQFGVGRVAISHRLANYQRVYDLTDRVIDKPLLDLRVTEHDAHRQLLARAATAFGIATLDDLADYYRMPRRMAEPRVQELVEDGVLREACVEGWPQRAYLKRGAGSRQQPERTVVLSPFDPLVWYRPRAERLFGFKYRIEIYVPEKNRRWGYYVLPVLMGDRLVARVDLKAERQAKTLSVRAAHLELHADARRTAASLAPELYCLGRWLGLEAVKVGRKGNLCRELRQACAQVAKS